MPVVHFTITGAFLMQTARDLMLSDEPGKAYRLLSQGLAGEGADKAARQVLAGEVDLTGDSTVGIDVAPAEDAAAYLRDLAYVYAGRVRLDQRWYRPRAVVTAYGPDDAKHAGFPVPVSEGLRDINNAIGAWSRKRATYYGLPGDRVEVLDSHAYIFEPCGEAPQWYIPASDPKEALAAARAAGRPIEETGAVPDRPRNEAEQMIREGELEDAEADALRELAYAAEDERFAAQLVTIRERVSAQAGEDVFELELLDGRVVKVPRAPFVLWAMHRVPGYDQTTLPAWQPVSPSGLKMQMDDTNHSDWLIGAGIDLKEAYKPNVNGPAWDHAMELQIAETDRARTGS